MINAKEEFLTHIKDLPKVKCAVIRDYDASWSRSSGKTVAALKKGYSDADLDTFLNELDFEYYDGYGGQELYGFIWYEGGTWSERYEYDGSECWDYKKSPKIPECCK